MRPMKTVLVFLLGLAAGCDGGQRPITGPADVTPTPEPGERVADAPRLRVLYRVPGTRLVLWTIDLASPDAGLYRLDVDAGTSSQLASGWQYAADIPPAAAAGMLFLPITISTTPTVDQRIRVLPLNGDSAYWFPAGGNATGPLVVSDDGRYLAYRRDILIDSMFVMDLVADSLIARLEHGRPRAFAPDGSALLFEEASQPRLLDFATGNVTIPSFSAAPFLRSPLQYRWLGGTLHALYWQTLQFATPPQIVIEPAGGQPRVIGTAEMGLTGLEWSADGSRVVYAISQSSCSGTGFFGGDCRPTYTTLHLMAAAGGPVRQVASTPVPGPLVVLDDGTIVHAVSDRIYRVRP